MWPGTNTDLAEKDVKSNGGPMPPDFDRFESFDHDELTVKHCYFRCSRPPDVDGIKSFDKDDQVAKHFFSKAYFSFLLLLFTLGVFLITFPSFFDPSGLRLNSSMTSYYFKAIASVI